MYYTNDGWVGPVYVCENIHEHYVPEIYVHTIYAYVLNPTV